MAPSFPRLPPPMQPVTFSADETFASSPATTFDAVLRAPLPGLFDRRYAALPPITQVIDQSGEWEHAGQTRTLVLSDGGTLLERLVAVEAPDRFDYELTRLRMSTETPT